MLALSIALLFAAACSAAPTGKLVYVNYNGTATLLKVIELANDNHISVSMVFPGNEMQPTWSESSASDGNSTFFYSFIQGDGVTGLLVGVDVNMKRELFHFDAPYFWRIGYDSSEPDALYGLSLMTNDVELVQVNLTTRMSRVIGKLPNSFTSPYNSAIYSNVTRTFYAFLQGTNGDIDVFGISVDTGKVTSKASEDTVYVCEAVLDGNSGNVYGVVQDSNSDAYLAKIDPVSGKTTRVGTDKFEVSACDADGTLSSSQRLYYAYLKDDSGNSQISIWNLDTGVLVQHFAIEQYVYGMQYFD